MFGFTAGLQASARFNAYRGITIRAYGGPAVDLRIVGRAGGLHEDDFTGKLETDAQMQTEAIRKYFWSRGRWFLPVIGGGVDIPVNELFLLGFDMRMWFPVYRLWTQEDIPGIDGWRFGLGLRITPRRAKPAPAEGNAPLP